MSDQHDIDNFFRNRFKDFEPAPDPEVWNKISDRLDEKKANEEKEGIVFLPWLYRAAGIAAAIALLFFAGNAIFNTTDGSLNSEEQTTSTTKQNSTDENLNGTQNNSEITDRNKNSQENSSQKDNNTIPENVLSNSKQVADENDKDATNAIKNASQQAKENTLTQGNALQNGVAQQEGTNTASQNTGNKNANTPKLQHKNLGNTKNAVANANDQKKTNVPSVQRKQRGSHVNNYRRKGQDYTSPLLDRVVDKKNATVENKSNTTNADNKNAAGVNSTTISKESTAVAQNELQKKTNSTDTNAISTKTDILKDSETINSETAVADTPKEEKTGKSILEVINDLHDLEKDKNEVADVPFNRWSVSPNASPVYYNSLGNGSPIHESFSDNTKSGDINLSYGVNVGYDVSKRLTVRSGIHRVDYSYSTKDIAIVPSIDGPNLTTIDFRGNNVAFNIQDRKAPTNETFSQYQVASTAESSIFQKQIEGDLNQRMSFIEVPVEVKYAILDKKIGINVIGGVSTLLLTENSIVLDSPFLLTELGEATNVNNVSFSTNIGFGIDYKISDKLEFNLEPMLKYQLNTFSRNTGNFNPYAVGVYTGVSFRF